MNTSKIEQAMKNLHKLYYKDYYKHTVVIEEKDKTIGGKKIVKMNIVENKTKEANIDYHFLLKDNKEEQKEIQKRNSKILNHPDGVNRLLTRGIYDEKSLPKIPCLCNLDGCFTLQTLYPGLITGVGIDHEAGVEGEFKLGMHFDYTHGMPVIHGSSVKGVLKTYFVDFASKYYLDIANKNNKQSEKQCNPKFTKDELIQLSYDIFEGKKPNKEGLKSIYERDIFFDVVIIEANKDKKILDSDTLCPHRDNPLKNPMPISFLKIASGVTIQFRFKLVDSKIGSQTMTKDEKLVLFKEILITVGIGAKTNVGYGQLKSST